MRDRLILEFGRNIKRIGPHVIITGDWERLSGYAVKEQWKLEKDIKLKGFEYFVNGGVACYEEEKAYGIVLLYKNKEIILADYYREAATVEK